MPFVEKVWELQFVPTLVPLPQPLMGPSTDDVAVTTVRPAGQGTEASEESTPATLVHCPAPPHGQLMMGATVSASALSISPKVAVYCESSIWSLGHTPGVWPRTTASEMLTGSIEPVCAAQAVKRTARTAKYRLAISVDALVAANLFTASCDRCFRHIHGWPGIYLSL